MLSKWPPFRPQHVLWQRSHAASYTPCLQWEEERATEGAVVIYIVKDGMTWRETQMNLISRQKLQNERISEIFETFFFPLNIIHDPLAVLVQISTSVTSSVTTHSELEIVDALEWCCEETCWVGNEKQVELELYVYHFIFPAKVTTALLPVAAL